MNFTERPIDSRMLYPQAYNYRRLSGDQGKVRGRT
jgi:hypothetical protein